MHYNIKHLVYLLDRWSALRYKPTYFFQQKKMSTRYKYS